MHTDGVDSYTFSSPHKHGHDGKQETITIHHCPQELFYLTNYVLSSPMSTYQLPASTDVPKCFLCSASRARLLSIALSLNRKGFHSTLIQPPWFDQLVITLVSSLVHIAFHFSIRTFQFYQYKGGVYPY
jgi:hypothetical protein